MTCGPLISQDWRNWVGSVYFVPTTHRKYLHPTPQTKKKRRAILDGQTFSSYLTPKHKHKSSMTTVILPYWKISPQSDCHIDWPVMKNITNNPHWHPAASWRSLPSSIAGLFCQSRLWEEPQASTKLWWCLYTACGARIPRPLSPMVRISGTVQPSHACLSSASFVYNSPFQPRQSEVCQRDKS